MTTEEWKERFRDLQPGDVVCFEDSILLKVVIVLPLGGCVFTTHSVRGGEVIPCESGLWDHASVVGRELQFSVNDDENDPADWWKT